MHSDRAASPADGSESPEALLIDVLKKFGSTAGAKFFAEFSDQLSAKTYEPFAHAFVNAKKRSKKIKKLKKALAKAKSSGSLKKDTKTTSVKGKASATLNKEAKSDWSTVTKVGFWGTLSFLAYKGLKYLFADDKTYSTSSAARTAR